MTQAQFQAAARYWEEKDAASVKLDPAQLRSVAEAYIQARNTCALATGAGAYVRCTPIEYSFHDGAFWMFSEGGKKFIGLSENPNVCLAIFDGYTGFQNLHGMQVMGKAEIVEPFSQDYLAHAAYKGISLDFLKGRETPMHLIRVRPTCMECLFSDFKGLGYGPRQRLVFDGETGQP